MATMIIYQATASTPARENRENNSLTVNDLKVIYNDNNNRFSVRRLIKVD